MIDVVDRSNARMRFISIGRCARVRGGRHGGRARRVSALPYPIHPTAPRGCRPRRAARPTLVGEREEEAVSRRRRNRRDDQLFTVDCAIAAAPQVPLSTDAAAGDLTVLYKADDAAPWVPLPADMISRDVDSMLTKLGRWAGLFPKHTTARVRRVAKNGRVRAARLASFPLGPRGRTQRVVLNPTQRRRAIACALRESRAVFFGRCAFSVSL